jgi:hypothetical protein
LPLFTSRAEAQDEPRIESRKVRMRGSFAGSLEPWSARDTVQTTIDLIGGPRKRATDVHGHHRRMKRGPRAGLSIFLVSGFRNFETHRDPGSTTKRWR